MTLRTAPLEVTLIAEQLARAVPGGIGVYIAGLASGLRRLTPPVKTFVLASASARRYVGLSSIGSVRLVPFGTRVLVGAWDRDLLRGPAVGQRVHATSFAFPSPKRQRPVPLSMFVHDLAWRHHPEAYPQRGIDWHERALDRALRTVNTFIVPSGSTAADLLDAGADPHRLHIVPEGCDHLPANRGDGWGDYLLTVSTLEPRKNLARVIEAYVRIRPSLPKPWPLRIVGPAGWQGHGGDGLPQHLPEGVELVGRVDDHELSVLYANARAFVYVPLLEGFGLPPLEAMRSGLPVVASTAVPSVGDSVEDGSELCLRVDPLDVDAIASAVFTALVDDERRATFRRGGLLLAAKRTWAASAAGHVRVWEQE